ncbi:MAG: SRPBCC family protein [Bacteroidota bacterium]
MRILKRILIVIAIIIAIPLVIALFVSKEMKSERSIVINKPKAEVFEYLKLVRNQDNFGVWQLSDPKMKSSDTGVDGTIGFKHAWESEVLGNGSQTITKIEDGNRIETKLDFGFGEPPMAYFTTEAQGENQTKVVWGINGTTPYPWNFFSLFMDMGKDFEQGLKNLKKELEKK